MTATLISGQLSKRCRPFLCLFLAAACLGCGARPKSDSVFISSGIAMSAHRIPTDYLRKEVVETFYPDTDEAAVESVGSTTSVVGLSGTFGLNSWRDARKQGNVIADRLAASDADRHDFIAHSQGCRIVLEGVYRFARYHDPDRPLLMRMVLTSPKIREAYLKKVIGKVKALAPNIEIQILVIYNPDDWKTPLTFFPYWLGPAWEPEDVSVAGVVKQIGVRRSVSFLDHEADQMLGFAEISPDDPDKDRKNALNRFLRESIAAFLRGEEYTPDPAFLKEFEQSGAAERVCVTTNAMESGRAAE